MNEINEKKLNKLIEIIYQFQEEKNQKQFLRFINHLKTINKKCDTNELRERLVIILDLISMEFLDSPELNLLKLLLTPNCDVFITVWNKAMGFYLPPDRQITPLPIPINVIYLQDTDIRILEVQFVRISYKKEVRMYWRSMGFYESMSLRYRYENRRILNRANNYLLNG